MKVVLISGKAKNGKDQSATILKELIEQDGKKVLIIHYADLLKFICRTYFDWNGKKDDVGRFILQYVGSDIIRKQDPDFWVNFVISFLTMFPTNWNYILIPDCRFPNEITAMKNKFDTFALRVNRIDFESDLTDEQKQHISETALDNYDFDYVINTVSDLDRLRTSLKFMYEEVLK